MPAKLNRARSHHKPKKPKEIAPPPVSIELEIDVEETEPMDGPPVHWIDRRRLPRMVCQVVAWLAPQDEQGALRRPIIRTRDINPLGVGFRAKTDLSALGEAILRLPMITGRAICVSCRVRRSRELGDGWFDGLIEFSTPAAGFVGSQRKNLAQTGAETAVSGFVFGLACDVIYCREGASHFDCDTAWQRARVLLTRLFCESSNPRFAGMHRSGLQFSTS